MAAVVAGSFTLWGPACRFVVGAVGGVVIGVAVGWGFTVPSLVRALGRRPAPRGRRASARERLVAGWSGMRGAVWLAAALACR